MEVFYCDVCRTRVSSVDIKAGKGGRNQGKIYCTGCLSKLKADPAEKIHVKALDGKVYTFSDWSKFSILVKKNLVNPDCMVRVPSETDTEWQPVREIARLAEMIGTEAASKTADRKKKSRPESPSLRRARKRSSAPSRKPDTGAARRKPAAEDAGPEGDIYGSEVSSETVSSEKPVIMNAIPALLSIIPGLGQAYNVTSGKAYMFGFLFITAIGLWIFKPAVGLYALAGVVFLSMCDAYGESARRGFWFGIGRGIVFLFKTFFLITGTVVWVIAVFICIDAVVCWTSSGTPLAAGLHISETAPAVKTWKPLWVSVIALGACVLMFLAHGAGRRFIWARRKRRSFSHALRVVLMAVVIVGILGISVNRFSSTKLFSVMHIPIKTIRTAADAPVNIANAFDAGWNTFTLGFLDKGTAFLSSFTEQAQTSLSSHTLVYNVILLAGCIVMLPLFFISALAYARTIPGLTDIVDIWRTEARERKKTLKKEWENIRKGLEVSRKRKEALKKVRHRNAMKIMKYTNSRLDRLETLVQQLSLIQAGDELTEEQRTVLEESLKKKPEQVPEPVVGAFRTRMASGLKRTWLFIKARAWPLLLAAGAAVGVSAGRAIKAAARGIKGFIAGVLVPGAGKAGKGVMSLPGTIGRNMKKRSEKKKKKAEAEEKAEPEGESPLEAVEAPEEPEEEPPAEQAPEEPAEPAEEPAEPASQEQEPGQEEPEEEPPAEQAPEEPAEPAEEPAEPASQEQEPGQEEPEEEPPAEQAPEEPAEPAEEPAEPEAEEEDSELFELDDLEEIEEVPEDIEEIPDEIEEIKEIQDGLDDLDEIEEIDEIGEIEKPDTEEED